MVTTSDIIRFVDAVATGFRPQRVVLFGSYAYGRPNDDSDVDVLVVTDSPGGPRESIRIRQSVPAAFPLDLVVRNDKDLAQRVQWNDFFLREITERGLVLYAADDPRMGAQGRRRLRRRLAPAARSPSKSPHVLVLSPLRGW